MAKQSAGILMYRRRAGQLELLLVHPGGPFWAKKDAGAWSIPKGEFSDGEDPLAAALREFEEETGMRPGEPFLSLTPVRQAGGKTVFAWAVEGDADAAAVRSNTFEMEWPPRSGRRQAFPEIDRAEWFEVVAATDKIIPAQAALIVELARHLASSP